MTSRAGAYLLGWATTPAPPATGARLAQQLAEADSEVDDDAGAATFRLGHLDGTWATFFDRRLTLHTTAEQAVTEAWTAYAGTMDATRARAALNPDPNPRQVAAAIIASGHPDERTAVAETLAGQLRDGQAEGRSGAAVLRQTGATPPIRESAGDLVDVDWELEFTTAWDALAGADANGLLLEDATGWLARIAGGAAGDLGRALAAVIEQGGGYEDLLAAAQAWLGAADPAAVKAFVDQAVSLALSQGALDLYSTEGITQVDFLTAGDQRVCPACADAEANNPWTANQAPRPGLHPGCRCVLMAAAPNPITGGGL